MNPRDAGVLLGIPIDRKSLTDTVDEAFKAIERRGPPVVFACANPHSLAVAQHDDMFRSALMQANVVVINLFNILHTA